MRKRRAVKREITPEKKYNSMLVARLINKIMSRGKKTIAERIVYEALEEAGKKIKMSPVEILDKAMSNVKPVLEVKSRRVGGATYQVPIEVRPFRSENLGLRWLIGYARQRKGKPMAKKLYEEILAAAKGEGLAVKKKEDTHKMADANRAFAHYRW